MSYNWDAYVVRAKDAAALAKVQAADPRAIAMPGGFARLGWDSSPVWSKSGSTIPWSARFGETWMFTAASALHVFGYEHGIDGCVLRSLGYDACVGWIVAEGEPETWEVEAFEGAHPAVGAIEPYADPRLVRIIAKSLGTQLIG
jgi:hypothetical protein